MINATNENVGLYVRLSRDDEREGESLSIENQKAFLLNYCREQGFENINIYSDDGYSGLSFDRPQMNRLLNDVKQGKINVIIAKDLSRIGRNQAKFSEIVDEFLPLYNCRLIAINDGVDTLKTNNDIMPFKNLFNEFYSRDLSRKVKTGIMTSAKKGNYINSLAPLGYVKDPENKYKLIIDADSAHIIKLIFKLRLDGYSYRKIAINLNDKKILTPSEYYYAKKGEPNKISKSKKWSDITVKSILSNENYIGNVVALKKTTVSYKNKKVVKRDKEEWIRVENTHEPIIDMETWDRAQSLATKSHNFRRRQNGEPALFSGLLKCLDCGSSLNQSRTPISTLNESKGYRYSYICGLYTRSGGCKIHRIQETDLIKLLKIDLENLISEISVDEEAFKSKIVSLKNQNSNAELSSVKKELNLAEKRIVEIEKMFQTLYEDKANGDIQKNMYDRLIKTYEQEHTDLTSQMKNLKEKVENTKSDYIDIDIFINIVKDYMGLKIIDRTLLLKLIDKIEVGESKEQNGGEYREINIYYNFLGLIK